MERAKQAFNISRRSERVHATAAALAVLLACGGGGSEAASPAAASGTSTATGTTAFLYQDVAPSSNSVRAGSTTDGRTVEPFGASALQWQGRGSALSYGDPVFSRLPNGRWALTGWTGSDDPRGAAALLYHESSCPRVDDSAVRALRPSSAAGCQAGGGLAQGKTSQVFSAEGGLFLFTMSGARVMLMRLGDGTRTAADLTSICVRSSRPSSLSALGFGEAAVVVEDASLLLSDTAIARRADGTWVLFVKGIARNNGCTQGGLCELCARRIYRTTSRDLLTWSALESVAEQASVPEAATFPDGNVRLYWQDFGPTCAAQDLRLAERAPIRGAAEDASGRFGASSTVTFAGETFETDTRLHYPTNANPVSLPDAAAASAYAACFGR